MRELFVGPLQLAQLKLRERLWHHDGRKCHWCGQMTLLCLEPIHNQATIDHIVPRCRGGPTRVENCVSACFTCNCKRNREDQARPDHPSNRSRVTGSRSA